MGNRYFIRFAVEPWWTETKEYYWLVTDEFGIASDFLWEKKRNMVGYEVKRTNTPPNGLPIEEGIYKEYEWEGEIRFNRI